MGNLGCFMGMNRLAIRIEPDCSPHHEVFSHLENTNAGVWGPTVWSVGRCAVTAVLLMRYSVGLLLPSWNPLVMCPAIPFNIML